MRWDYAHSSERTHSMVRTQKEPPQPATRDTSAPQTQTTDTTSRVSVTGHRTSGGWIIYHCGARSSNAQQTAVGSKVTLTQMVPLLLTEAPALFFLRQCRRRVPTAAVVAFPSVSGCRHSHELLRTEFAAEVSSRNIDK